MAAPEKPLQPRRCAGLTLAPSFEAREVRRLAIAVLAEVQVDELVPAGVVSVMLQPPLPRQSMRTRPAAVATTGVPGATWIAFPRCRVPRVTTP